MHLFVIFFIFFIGNDLQHQAMIADMIAWAEDHPPPAIHMLITNDGNCVPEAGRFYGTLGELEEQGYAILLVRSVPEFILSPTLDWSWETFLEEPKV